jgi:hypothetical protein
LADKDLSGVPGGVEPGRPRWRFRGPLAVCAVSGHGTSLSPIAPSLFSHKVTGSALGPGLLMALRLSAGVLARHVAGRLTGRRNRRAGTAGTAGFAVGVLLCALALEAMPVLTVVGIFHGGAICAAAGFLVLLPRIRARSHQRHAITGESSYDTHAA